MTDQAQGVLAGRVAVVTGASRGIGKGVALALGEAGATVYILCRTAASGDSVRPGSAQETAAEVTRRGGRGVALPCDLADDAGTKAAFDRVAQNEGRIDILVNSAFATGASNARDLYRPFWELETAVWDAMINSGLRGAFTASACAAREMVKRSSGLIVNVSSFGAVRYHMNVPYHAGKAGLDKMTADMAYELRPHNVAVVSLWPGLVLTEGVMARPEGFELRKADTPIFLGRLVAALAADPATIHRSGMAWGSFELGRDFHIPDGLNEAGEPSAS